MSMERGESSAEKKRKHSDDDDDASPSHRSVRANTPPSPDGLSLQLSLLPSLPLFDLNSPPPPESPSHTFIPSPPSPESPSHSPIPSPPPLDDAPPPPPPLDAPPPPPPPTELMRRRRNPSKGPGAGKSETIPPPFPWATDRRATVHSLEHLASNKITDITGHAQCKRCDQKFTLEFNVNEKFCEVLRFIMERKDDMYTRAPEEWLNPKLLNCEKCKQENCVKPIIIPKNKKCMNWLFLFLGQWLGLCSLGDLKYFCKHTNNHRTGAKDRVLYLTYISLCRQLCPDSPFKTYYALKAESDRLRKARESNATG